ncbi:hypothetical protein OBE_13794, partial [human gut metagenome]
EMSFDAIKEQGVEGSIIYACGPTPMLRGIKAYAEEMGNRSTDFHGRENGVWNRCMLSMCV